MRPIDTGTMRGITNTITLILLVKLILRLTAVEYAYVDTDIQGS
jgi:hypothetical protein